MASIFTFEPDIPRVSSPWTRRTEDDTGGGESVSRGAWLGCTPIEARPNVPKLVAEPQAGPVEYKLHLLLRPRRTFVSIEKFKGIARGGQLATQGTPPRNMPSMTSSPAMSPAAPLTAQARQHRLEQLTTQLLWRLQQSSPHHTSSASNVILPSLPEALPELHAPSQPASLLHGLEESQGALYEIGVSDDGTFVGLAEDEMKESLNNLRAMASCLGCTVQVARMVAVGQGEWLEDDDQAPRSATARRRSRLLVAEASVRPDLTFRTAEPEPLGSSAGLTEIERLSLGSTLERAEACSQLRISLTGATMSGKSSLLGTLSTSTLDNAKGKSRLSMLKHRHEISSGVTSSVSQELLGYRESNGMDTEVVNYAAHDVNSWIDIHAASAQGRLVFVSDSAGHPRYRRTTVRGLVGWAPHWTLLCISANDDETQPPHLLGSLHDTGVLSAHPDLSAAHLHLCLRLDLPLVVVITKLDTASKSGLRVVLAKLLSALKAAYRRPMIIPDKSVLDDDGGLQTVPATAMEEVQKLLRSPDFDATTTVPIVMTSSVNGTGIQVLHALLHELPATLTLLLTSESVGPTFYIEDIYSKPLEPDVFIVAGLLQQGQITVSDKLWLGPCSAATEDSDESDGTNTRRPSGGPSSRSFPGALRTSNIVAHIRGVDSAEWQQVDVVSIRNLRLPVNALQTDQAGTIALVLSPSNHQNVPRIRKGMVLSARPSRSSSAIIAEFRRDDLGSLAVGSQVIVYIASVRTSARIMSASIPGPNGHDDEDLLVWSAMTDSRPNSGSWDSGGTRLEHVAGAVTHEYLHVRLHFDVSKEYIDPGTKILVMPGGGPSVFGNTEGSGKGFAGLEGFVGKVIDVLG